MPRKAKDEIKNDINLENNIKKQVAVKSEKSSTKKTTSSTQKKLNSAEKKSKITTKNSININSAKTTNKHTKKSSTSKKELKKEQNTIVEYYDLPYRYNETVVKILAQTPTTLFIYWDISDADRASYVQKYGKDFFEKTKPILIVTNKTMNYSFEVEINDFANSWYLHVNDANCDYYVELGRRPITYISNVENYIYVTSSNDIETPNNHILFDKLGNSVFFKNVKNNFINEVPIASISYIKRLGKFCNIYELYKEIYNNEINIEDLSSNNIELNLSSSNSSTFM